MILGSAMLLHPEFDPVALRIGPLAVRWYGLMYMLGFAAGWTLGRGRASRPGSGWDAREVDDLVALCMFGLIVGARLGYVLFYDLPLFLAEPVTILEIWKGGMSFHGGLAGICLCLWWFGRKTGRSFMQVADFLVPLCPLGLLAGRMGNFINGELWGRPTDLPWGMVFPGGGIVPRHPSQLYEAGLEGVALFTIVWMFSSKKRPAGAVGGLFALLYGCFRFSVEFVRQPDPQLGYIAFNWLTMGQLLSVPLMLIGGFLLWRAYTK